MDSKKIEIFQIDLLHKIQSLNLLQSQIEMNLAYFIDVLVGINVPITFNDETAYPNFVNMDGDNEAVVGIKIDESFNILFNVEVGDDDYGLNPDDWFNPKVYGNYKYSDVLVCINNWINYHEISA